MCSHFLHDWCKNSDNFELSGSYFHIKETLSSESKSLLSCWRRNSVITLLHLINSFHLSGCSNGGGLFSIRRFLCFCWSRWTGHSVTACSSVLIVLHCVTILSCNRCWYGKLTLILLTAEKVWVGVTYFWGGCRNSEWRVLSLFSSEAPAQEGSPFLAPRPWPSPTANHHTHTRGEDREGFADAWVAYLRIHSLYPPLPAGCSPRAPRPYHSSSKCSQCRTTVISQAAQPSHSKTLHVNHGRIW